MSQFEKRNQENASKVNDSIQKIEPVCDKAECATAKSLRKDLADQILGLRRTTRELVKAKLLNHSLRDLLTRQSRKLLDVQRMAYFDHLTGLPNRTLLLDRFELAVANARRDQGKIGLLFIDVNAFKGHNDNHGHMHGDSLLQGIALTLLSTLREIDTASRFGGDEFVILLPRIESRRDAMIVASKISAAISRPKPDWHPAHALTVSIGVSVFPDDGQELLTLLKSADQLMYQAKSLNRLQ